MILNSHYLAKLDDETMLDLDNQEAALNKEKLKKTIISEVSQTTNTPIVLK